MLNVKFIWILAIMSLMKFNKILRKEEEPTLGRKSYLYIRPNASLSHVFYSTELVLILHMGGGRKTIKQVFYENLTLGLMTITVSDCRFWLLKKRQQQQFVHLTCGMNWDVEKMISRTKKKTLRFCEFLSQFIAIENQKYNTLGVVSLNYI